MTPMTGSLSLSFSMPKHFGTFQFFGASVRLFVRSFVAYVLGCIQRLSLAKQSTFFSPMTHIRMISNRMSGFWKIVFSNTCMWQAICIGDVSFPTSTRDREWCYRVWRFSMSLLVSSGTISNHLTVKCICKILLYVCDVHVWNCSACEFSP